MADHDPETLLPPPIQTRESQNTPAPIPPPNPSPLYRQTPPQGLDAPAGFERVGNILRRQDEWLQAKKAKRELARKARESKKRQGKLPKPPKSRIASSLANSNPPFDNISQARSTSSQASDVMQPINTYQDYDILHLDSHVSQASNTYHVNNSSQPNTPNKDYDPHQALTSPQTSENYLTSSPYQTTNASQGNASYQGYGPHQALTSSQTSNSYLTSRPYRPINTSQGNASYQGYGPYRSPNSSQLQENYLSSSSGQPTHSYQVVNPSPRINISGTTNVSHVANRFQELNSSRHNNPYPINGDFAGAMRTANATDTANASNLYQATNSYLTGSNSIKNNTYVPASSPQLTTPFPPARTMEDYIRSNTLPKPNIPLHNPYTNPIFAPTQAYTQSYTQAQASQAQASQAQAPQAQAPQAQASQAQVAQFQVTQAQVTRAQANQVQVTQAQVAPAQVTRAQALQAPAAEAQPTTPSRHSNHPAPPCIPTIPINWDNRLIGEILAKRTDSNKYWSHKETIEFIQKELWDKARVYMPHVENAWIDQIVEDFMDFYCKKDTKYEDEEFLDIFGYKKFVEGDVWTWFDQDDSRL